MIYYNIEALKDDVHDHFHADLIYSKSDHVFLKRLKESCEMRELPNTYFRDMLIKFYQFSNAHRVVWLSHTVEVIMIIGGDDETESWLSGTLEFSDLGKKPSAEEIILKHFDEIKERQFNYKGGILNLLMEYCSPYGYKKGWVKNVWYDKILPTNDFPFKKDKKRLRS